MDTNKVCSFNDKKINTDMQVNFEWFYLGCRCHFDWFAVLFILLFAWNKRINNFVHTNLFIYIVPATATACSRKYIYIYKLEQLIIHFNFVLFISQNDSISELK